MEYNEILKNAEYEMKKLRHPYVGSEHLLLSILASDDEVVATLNKYSITYNSFSKNLVKIVGNCKKDTPYVLHTPLFKRIIENANDIASNKNEEIGAKHLIVSLIEESDGIAIRVLLNMGVDLDALYNDLVKNSTGSLSLGKELDSDSILIGREREIESIISSLLKKDKCNPLLIGNAGVGKTAIVTELARRLKKKEVPDKLIGYKIISIEMGSLVAGTKYRGEFEEKLHNLIDSLINNKIILFIDEIHTLVNAGGADGAINAADILKPYLARGDIKIIGATTIAEYNNTILKDKALNRRFDLITIKETDYEATKDILEKVKNKYEVFHDLVITDENIKDIMDYSNRYIHNRYNPDKSLEVLDLVCAKVNSSCNYIKKYNERNEKKKEYILKDDYEGALKELENASVDKQTCITKEDILAVISNIINADILTSKEALVKSLNDKLQEKVINQKEAISRIISNIRYKLFKDNEVLSLQFVGGSGVGKSMVIEEISKTLKRNKIVINLEDYSYDESIEKLVGGTYRTKYVFQEVKNEPCSILEINNYNMASPKVKELFNTIISDGECLDYNSEKICFNNTIVIFNETTKKSIGFSENIKESEDIIVDEVIGFNAVTKEDINTYIDRYNKENNTSLNYESIASSSNYKLNGYKGVIKSINKELREQVVLAQ